MMGHGHSCEAQALDVKSHVQGGCGAPDHEPGGPSSLR